MSTTSKDRTRGTVGWRSHIRTRLVRGESETGAVLVEAAFVFPVFMLLLFGMIEFGFIFKDSLTLSTMVQTGARTGAEAGNNSNPSADYEILSTMSSGAASLNSTLQYVIVFDANDNTTTPDGAPIKTVPSACVDAGIAAASNNVVGTFGVPGVCNVYDETQWTAVQAGLSPAQLGTDFNGSASAWDGDWSPGGNSYDVNTYGQDGRQVAESSNNNTGPDYLGVYIAATHKNITGFFPTVTLHEADIIRLEPQSFQ